MRWEIEESGCCERKGMRQVRICFYLEPGDARYSEHHVNMPVHPKGGYKGKQDERGKPDSVDDYKSWRDTLPKKWQTNPFHNHFIRVAIDATDEDIAQQAEALLPQFYGKWRRREKLGVTDGNH